MSTALPGVQERTHRRGVVRVWRAVTSGGPIMLGGVCLAAWRLGLVPPRPGTEPAT